MNRHEFFFSLVAGRSAEAVEQIQMAYWLAKSVHRDQKRDSGERYFEHPRRVATLLLERGNYHGPVFDGPSTIACALLHDAIEDTNVPFKVIINLFGADVWNGLQLLSKKIPAFDPVTGETLGRIKKDTATYFAALAKGPAWVQAIKVADRIDNLEDCQMFSPEKAAKYLRETKEYIVPMACTIGGPLKNKLDRAVSRLETFIVSEPISSLTK